MDDPRATGRSGRRGRLHPPVRAGQDPTALLAVHEAARQLTAARSPQEVVGIVVALVTSLGADVMPARTADADALPWDLSFGVDEPLLPVAEPTSVPRLNVETLLPGFLEDARRVVMELRLQSQDRPAAS